MPSHSEGPGIWLSVWRFLLTHCLYERAGKVLARLCGSAGTPEPLLLAYAIGTKFAWRGPFEPTVFGISDQVRLKLTCSATEAIYSLEILYIASRGIILSRQRTTKALIRLRGCTGWSAPLLFAYRKNRFSDHDAHLLLIGRNCENPKSCHTSFSSGRMSGVFKDENVFSVCSLPGEIIVY